MDIIVKGKQRLSGEICPSGSKNSAVALIPATILFDKPVVLENIPNITDVKRLILILEKLGSKINWNKIDNKIVIDNSNLKYVDLYEEDLGDMKGTSLLWGPMLARFKKVRFNRLPGGCTLGFRSLAPHYNAFSKMGVEVKQDIMNAEMNAEKAKGCELLLEEISPTATENVIMLATGLKGETKIFGAASEPQVQDLCSFLVKCGVKIEGIGSNVITVKKTSDLFPVKHKILSDHYEIATFLTLSAATGGELKVHNAIPELFTPIANTFSKFGINIDYKKDLAILRKDQKITIDDSMRGYMVVKAQPWPHLPVDCLPLFIPLALASDKGQVLFHNWMYEAGLFWTSELQKLGANIIMGDPHRVIVTAGNKLRGAVMEAPYIIRAVTAMVIACMISEGESTILNADALYRGHPDFAKNLRNLGAAISEVNGSLQEI